MPLGEILISLIFLYYRIPSPEAAIGEVIKQQLTRDLLGFIIGFILFIIPIIAFLGLIDGILKLFNYTLVDAIEDIVKKMKQ